MTVGRRLRRPVRALLDRALSRYDLKITSVHDDPRAWGRVLVDTSTALPEGAADHLRPDNPYLLQLRRDYAALDWPVVTHSRWKPEKVESWLDLQHFRGDNSYVWHYREGPRLSELKFFVFLEHVARRDQGRLLERLEEDGAFGCWTYSYAGRPRVSRDLLDSVNELTFLDRHLGVLSRERLRILDIGAGYGRLAHRTAQVAAGLVDYCCVDAIPQSTFLSEYYTRVRAVAPPVRVVPLTGVPSLTSGSFDLACNVHSFSECTLDAISWWMDHLRRLDVPTLFLVPNEPDGLLSLETDGSRRDYLPVIEAAGYRLAVSEPAFDDPAVRELLEIEDRHLIFERVEPA